MAKRYFADHGIDFSEHDVITDAEARRRMALMTGQFGVPVIQVGGHAMVGWNPEEFERLRNGDFRRR